MGSGRFEQVRLLDLCCGRWGLSRAFAARGWECIGVDLTRPPEIPAGCTFVEADLRTFAPGPGFDFAWASTPCQEFSVHGMPMFHKRPPYPELGIELFNCARKMLWALGCPWIMENVRAAERFIGVADAHCGPFYL